MLCWAYHSRLCFRATTLWGPAGMSHQAFLMCFSFCSPVSVSHLGLFMFLLVFEAAASSLLCVFILLHLFLLQTSAFSTVLLLFQPEISTPFPFFFIFYYNFQSISFSGWTWMLCTALKYVLTAWESSLLRSVFYIANILCTVARKSMWVFCHFVI